MNKIEVDIEINGKKEKVKFRNEITIGKDREIMSQVTTTKVDETTGEINSIIDKSLLTELRLVAYLEEAPFKIELEEVRKLSRKVGLKLIDLVGDIVDKDVISEDDKKK